jgi:hypothetical protein
LNLGTPFESVDDVINQTEDAMQVGFRVLEEVVNEIKAGYEVAQNYNAARRRFVAGENDPATGAKQEEPSIPWEDMVKRLSSVQDISFRAMKDGTKLYLDSAKSGMDAVRNFADTVAKSRADTGDKVPRLAGPIFEDTLVIEVVAGQSTQPKTYEKQHAGLARLRILAQADPLVQLDVPAQQSAAALTLAKVRFEPSEDPDKKDVSVLYVDPGMIRDDQTPATYEGFITATNFELLIARVRVIVGKGP